MATVKDRVAKKAVEIRALGKDSVLVISKNYDPTTGDQLDDSVNQFNISGLKNDLVNIDAQIAQLEAQKADVAALIEFAEKEIAKAKPEKEVKK